MTIDLKPGQTLPPPDPPPAWGEITPSGQTAAVLRIVLPECVVSYPTSELRRWEHRTGSPELFTIRIGNEEIAVEGTDLGPVRAALDLGRLCELRLTYKSKRPGPQIQRIAIEPR